MQGKRYVSSNEHKTQNSNSTLHVKHCQNIKIVLSMRFYINSLVLLLSIFYIVKKRPTGHVAHLRNRHGKINLMESYKCTTKYLDTGLNTYRSIPDEGEDFYVINAFPLYNYYSPTLASEPLTLWLWLLRFRQRAECLLQLCKVWLLDVQE